MRDMMRGIVASAAMMAVSSTAAEPGGNQTGPGRRRQVAPRGTARANLSRWHPDYGMTPLAHAEQKARRRVGEVPFLPKADLRKRRGGLLASFGL